MTKGIEKKPGRRLFLKLTFIGAVLLAGGGVLGSSYAAEAGKPQEESLMPYTRASEVPQTVVDLWKDYDPRKEELEIEIHKEWKQDGVVSRLPATRWRDRDA